MNLSEKTSRNNMHHHTDVAPMWLPAVRNPIRLLSVPLPLDKAAESTHVKSPEKTQPNMVLNAEDEVIKLDHRINR